GYRILYMFRGTPADVTLPYGTLAVGTNGVLYGTTDQGGINAAGTVFRINRDGTGYRVLLHCAATNVGTNPRGQLIVGDDGALYGTTQFGDRSTTGTIYKIPHEGSG